MKTATFMFYCTQATTDQTYTVPEDCMLVGIDWAASFLSTADATSGILVIATQPLANTYTTGAPGFIGCLRSSNSLTTSGDRCSEANKYQGLMPGIPLSKNSVIHCYSNVNGAMTTLANITLFFVVP